MKTQTAEEFLKDKDAIDCLWTENDEDICKALNEFATTQIEALRERLKKNLVALEVNNPDFPEKSENKYVIKIFGIDSTINEFLKEINE